MATEVRYPMPSMASKPVISSFAEEVATTIGYETGMALEPIIANLGGVIEFRNAVVSGSSNSESIKVRSESDFTIYLGTLTSPERDRFTVAHELGHLCIHYPLVVESSPGSTMIATRWVDETDGDQRRAEWEANWFAAALLMPSATFKRQAKTMKTLELASFFGVSYTAAEIRKKSLGIA